MDRPDFHRQFCLQLLKELCAYWRILYRERADGFNWQSTATLANNTPDVSYLRSDISAIVAGGSVRTAGIQQPAACNEVPVSLYFAAHDIFCRLAPLLVDPLCTLLVLDIFYELLPFIVLYLDIVVCSVDDSTQQPVAVEDSRERFESWSLFYLGLTIDSVTKMLAIHQQQQQQQGISEQNSALLIWAVNRFQLDLMLEFASAAYYQELSLRSQASILVKMIQFVAKFEQSLLPYNLAYAVYLRGVDHMIPMATGWLKRHTPAKYYALKALYDYILQISGNTGQAARLNPEFLYNVAFHCLYDQSEADIRQLAGEVLRLVVRLPVAPLSLKSILCLLQPTFSIDDGALYREAMNKAAKDLNDVEKLCLHLQSLFHKDSK